MHLLLTASAVTLVADRFVRSRDGWFDISTAGPVLVSVQPAGTRREQIAWAETCAMLSRLRQFPLDTLKIDRSFVSEITASEDDAPIVSATIAMAHSLGLSAVAEGVEDEATLEALAALGCDQVQGYLVAPPMAGSALAPWLRESGHFPAVKTVF